MDEIQERVPVHVHVMAAKVERNKKLEDERMLWIRRGEITEQATRGCPDHTSRQDPCQNESKGSGKPNTPISDHIEHGAKL